jgi:hypothetical protein
LGQFVGSPSTQVDILAVSLSFSVRLSQKSIVNPGFFNNTSELKDFIHIIELVLVPVLQAAFTEGI